MLMATVLMLAAVNQVLTAPLRVEAVQLPRAR